MSDQQSAVSEREELWQGVRADPRAYQQRIVRKAIAMFDGSYRDQLGNVPPAARSVLIESPTGSGKTVMGLAVARWLQEQAGCRVGWVSMRRNLLSQAERENVERHFGVELELISMFDRDPPRVDALVVDEAQHDAAMSMANLHCAIQPKFILGLTATPFRMDRIKLCFDAVLRDAGIHQLIQDGYLSRYHHFTIPKYAPETVAETLSRERDRWGKSLVFFHRQEQCEACADILRSYGVEADIVTAKTDRERQIRDFSTGRTRVLINMAILSEGFDCPSVRTVFCRPSGRGFTIQMGGRVFRKHPDLPIKQIVQCQETRHPFLKTALPEEQYVWADQGWQSLRLNREIEAISNRVRQSLTRARVELPGLVKQHCVQTFPWEGRGD